MARRRVRLNRRAGATAPRRDVEARRNLFGLHQETSGAVERASHTRPRAAVLLEHFARGPAMRGLAYVLPEARGVALLVVTTALATVARLAQAWPVAALIDGVLSAPQHGASGPRVRWLWPSDPTARIAALACSRSSRAWPPRR